MTSIRHRLSYILCGSTWPGARHRLSVGAPPIPSAARAIGAWADQGLEGREYTTPHYRLVSTLRDRSFEAGLPAFLEAMYGEYAKTMPPTAANPNRRQLFVFGCRSDWQRFVQRRYPARYHVYSLIRSGGFTEDGTAVVFFTDRASTLATLAHEGWHLYQAPEVTAAMPAWLNEALASYFESVDCSGPNPVCTPMRNTFRINHLREAVQHNRLLPLRVLLNADAGQIHRQDNSALSQTYYAQLWALVTFLRHGAGAGAAARSIDYFVTWPMGATRFDRAPRGWRRSSEQETARRRLSAPTWAETWRKCRATTMTSSSDSPGTAERPHANMEPGTAGVRPASWARCRSWRTARRPVSP